MKELTLYTITRGRYESKMLVIEWGDTVANTFDKDEALTILEKCKNDYDYEKSSNKMYGIQVEENIFFVDDDFEDADNADEVARYGDFDHCEDVIAEWNYKTWKREKDQEKEKEASVEMDEAIAELSKLFSMRAICDKAGIKYQTYKNYKTGGASLSNEKKYMLLKTMIEAATEYEDILMRFEYKVW